MKIADDRLMVCPLCGEKAVGLTIDMGICSDCHREMEQKSFIQKMYRIIEAWHQKR